MEIRNWGRKKEILNLVDCYRALSPLQSWTNSFDRWTVSQGA
jgi:hypothetical protein